MALAEEAVLAGVLLTGGRDLAVIMMALSMLFLVPAMFALVNPGLGRFLRRPA